MTTAITRSIDYITNNELALRAEVPEGTDFGRLKRTVQALLLQADRDKSKLSNCTPASIVHAVLRVVHLGLDMDNKEAHIVTYGREATVMIDYRGLLVMARRGGVLKVEVDIVRDGDDIDYHRGSDPGETWLRHHPLPFNSAPIVGAYALFHLEGGTVEFEAMSKDEVDVARSKAAKGSGAWKDFYGEMAKKVVLRRGLKRLPMRPDDQKAIAEDTKRHVVYDVTPDGGSNARLNAQFMGPAEVGGKSDSHASNGSSPLDGGGTDGTDGETIDMETGEIDPDMSAAPYVPGVEG